MDKSLIGNITKNSKGKKLDFALLFAVLVLLCLGLIVLSSASSYYALVEYNNSSYYLIRQIGFAVLGIAAMLVISKIDYKIYIRFGYLIYIVGIVLMLMVFIPGLSGGANGANRWLNLGIARFQPSEIMKISLIVGISTYLEKNRTKTHSIKGYIVPLGMLALVCLIMYFQSHMSGTIIMIAISAAVVLVDGIRFKKGQVILIVFLILAVLAIFLFTDGYRLKRVTAMFNLQEDIRGSNWQPTQSLYAIGAGGVFGKGLGQSRQKYLWLPEAQNDFIFSVYAEEFGFVGGVIVLTLYAFFLIRGYIDAMKSNSKYGMMLAAAIITMFAVQIIINIAVVTVLFPTTGMPLPFFSAGGTALVINLVAVGVVLNISRQGK